MQKISFAVAERKKPLLFFNALRNAMHRQLHKRRVNFAPMQNRKLAHRRDFPQQRAVVRHFVFFVNNGGDFGGRRFWFVY